MRRTRNRSCHVRLWSTIALLLACQGCVVNERKPISSQLIVPGGEAMERAERREDLPDAPLIIQTSMASAFSIDPRGSLSYDGFTLPIACPSAGSRLLAVQSGSRPSWDALLARSTDGAAACSVAIYECESGKPPTLVAEHPDGVILGRTANQEGVLVERPNQNGSRWIGLAPWSGGSIRWLVFDDNVNAFAWINEDSTLVYAQRTREENYFELVVRRANGSTWRLTETLPYSWILPALDPDGEGLYALRLGEGFADLAWGQLENLNTFRQTLALHRVSDRVNPRRAWQILAATTGGSGLSTNQIAWFSFELGRLVLWNPRTGKIDLLPTGTVAACADGAEHEWFITTLQKLERLAILKTTNATAILLSKPWIARSRADDSVVIVLADDKSLEVATLQVDHERPTDEQGASSSSSTSSPSTSNP